MHAAGDVPMVSIPIRRLVCIVACVLATPAGLTFADDALDPLLEAELDEIVGKHKAPVERDPSEAAAAKLALRSEKLRTLRTPVYVPKVDPRETFRASLATHATVGVGPWYLAGPFDNAGGVGLETAYPPERGIDTTADFVGLDGRRFGWQRLAEFREAVASRIDLPAARRKPAVAYLYRRLVAKAPVEAPFLIGCRWPTVVFLNGRPVARGQGGTRLNVARTKLWLKLRAGDNALLVKAFPREGRVEFGCADYATRRDDVEQMILARIRREMPDADAGLLREWEIERDWLQRDRDLLARGFGPAARQALKLAAETLALVERAAARPKLAAELAGLQRASEDTPPQGDWQKLYFAARRLRRRMILSHPLLGFDRLLINQRTPPGYSHMCDQYLGRHSGAGEGLLILEGWRDQPRARKLIGSRLPVGATHHPDLSHDGRRVLFAFCDHTETDLAKRRFWLYEVGVDGDGLRRITGIPGRDPMEGHDGRRSVLIEDWDPCYLPDGGIVFISTRNQAFGRCHGGRYTPAYVLYRCDADGSNIRRISWGEANEWDPAVLHDGRVVYTRWDYINRHDTLYQSLWTTRPDGTATAHFYGNNTRNPCMIAEAKAIPGSHRVVATAMAHHSYTSGSIIVIDPLKGLDGAEPIRRITPEAPFPETEGWPTGTYCTPWPLSEDLFLAAYTPDRLAGQGSRQRDNAYGIYLVDAAGGRELIYRDPNMSSFSPIPIQPRPRPPALASSLRPEASKGTFFVQNVYVSGQNTGRPIPPGKARHLRVVGIVEQPEARAPVRSCANNEVVKRILGTVPIEPDGSVAFRAPAGEPLLFQVLDENYMSVMSMRSQAYLQPGESMSCVGCHEPIGAAGTPRGARPLEVRAIAPPPGPKHEGCLSFARTVQPVLDRYCIGCHGLARGGDVAERDLRAELSGVAPTPRTTTISLLGTPTGRFCASYESLTGGGRIRLAQRNGETPISQPMDYGAHASKIAPMLLAGHKGRVKLDTDSFRRIAGWLDLNVQYYGDYVLQNRPERRRPSPAGEKALRQHLRDRCGGCHKAIAAQPFAALVNIACPGESRVLNAPLPVSAGGWGQCKSAFTGPGDKRYEALRERVAAAVGGSPR